MAKPQSECAMETKLIRIAKIASEDGKVKLNNLVHMLNVENLKECFFQLRKNSATGVDNMSWEEYKENLDDNLTELVASMKRNLIKMKDWWKILQAKLRGHFQYYGVSGNYRWLMRFYIITIKLLHKWINRRSQKKSMNWREFIDYINRYNLPKPKIYHNLYTLCGY
jgi:hypothetical protein